MMRLSILTLSIFLLVNQLQAYNIPCNKDGEPSGCDPNRIKRVTCGVVPSWASSASTRIMRNSNSECWNNNPRMRDTIKNLNQASNKYYVEFDDRDGKCYGIVMQGGECWGRPYPSYDGNWDCMGRCGPACGGVICSNWSRDCLKHDVCGWYHKSRGVLQTPPGLLIPNPYNGATDPDCGDEFVFADNDYQSCCVWPCRRRCKGQKSTC